jgi:RNA polymerase sigma-70 factor, ECF subfamily
MYGEPKRPWSRWRTRSGERVPATGEIAVDYLPMNAVEAPRPLARSFPSLLVYRKLTDADLVQRANEGDGWALEALIERYSAKVSRLASQLLEDIEDARDAAQESLLKLSVRLRQFRGECQFSTWLHRLVVNTCHDLAARQRLRRTEVFDPDAYAAVDLDGDPSRIALLGDLRRELAAGLARLTSDQRRVILLRDALDFGYEDISRAVRIPVGTAKTYVHRGRERLRKRLREYGGA